MNEMSAQSHIDNAPRRPAHTVDELRAIAKQYRHADDHTTADAYESLANFRARLEGAVR